MERDEIQVHERPKPTLYTADGREITVTKPLGFARHPEVPKPPLLKEKS